MAHLRPFSLFIAIIASRLSDRPFGAPVSMLPFWNGAAGGLRGGAVPSRCSAVSYGRLSSRLQAGLFVLSDARAYAATRQDCACVQNLTAMQICNSRRERAPEGSGLQQYALPWSLTAAHQVLYRCLSPPLVLVH